MSENWFSAKYDKPVASDWYLVYDREVGSCYIAYFDTACDAWYEESLGIIELVEVTDGISHWTMLPPPPDDEE